VQVLAVTAFPIYVWAILNFLRDVPNLLLKLNTWAVVSVLAYVLVFALLESLVVFIIFLVLSILLPAGWLRQQLVVRATIINICTALWSMVAHFLIDTTDIDLSLSFFIPFGFGVILYGLVLGGLLFLAHRRQRISALITAFAERLVVLSYLYMFLGVLGLLIIILRNVITN
jgi:hypothetical protein